MEHRYIVCTHKNTSARLAHARSDDVSCSRVVSAVVGMPLAVYSRLDDREYIHFVSYRMCMEEWPSTTLRAVYAGVIMLLQFVVPVVVLIVIHWKICNFLKTRILQVRPLIFYAR